MFIREQHKTEAFSQVIREVWTPRSVSILMPLMISSALIFGPPRDTKASNTL